MQKAKVVFLVLVPALAYGVVHDQITARLCLEYFTVAHPPLFETTSPTRLALLWGVAATFGIGMLFGILVAQASQSPGMPPMSLSAVARRVLILLTITATAAFLAGLIGFELARSSIVRLDHAWDDILTRPQQDRFIAVWFAHTASYVVGLVGATIVVVRIWNERQRPHLFTLFPQSRADYVRTVIIILLAVAIVWLRWK